MIAVDITTIKLYDKVDIKETVNILLSCKEDIEINWDENKYCDAIDVAIGWLQKIERGEIK